MKKIAAIILIVLGLVMMFLGYQLTALPPALTGVGFVVIALVFLSRDK